MRSKSKKSNLKNLEKVAIEQVQSFLERIIDEYEDLSNQLKIVAQYVLENKDNIAVLKIQMLADGCSVQPSTIIRFAQRFGFKGFSDMQAIFKQRYLSNTAHEYDTRIQNALSQDVKMHDAENIINILTHCEAGIADIKANLLLDELEISLNMMLKAQAFYIVGVRRMFPIASYLAYSLHHLQKKTFLVDGMGAMGAIQVHSIESDDLLIAFSMQPYAKETQIVIETAHKNKAKILLITDSYLSPLAKLSSHIIKIKEQEVYSFRVIAGLMSFTQGLFITYAAKIEQDQARHKKI
ncbi:RpiR family transcriptional regulator [Gammaproteobacteria bacterium]|nr:RpiR family transcriptional regulator [Gammaproteobacteria bacterium]